MRSRRSYLKSIGGSIVALGAGISTIEKVRASREIFVTEGDFFTDVDGYFEMEFEDGTLISDTLRDETHAYTGPNEIISRITLEPSSQVSEGDELPNFDINTGDYYYNYQRTLEVEMGDCPSGGEYYISAEDLEGKSKAEYNDTSDKYTQNGATIIEGQCNANKMDNYLMYGPFMNTLNSQDTPEHSLSLNLGECKGPDPYMELRLV